MALTGEFQNLNRDAKRPTTGAETREREATAAAAADISHQEPACCSQANKQQQQPHQQPQVRETSGQEGAIKLEALGEPPGVARVADETQRNINANSEPDDSDSGDETDFDYEPVLTKILNEKKLALSYSADVLRFLSSQQAASQAPPLGHIVEPHQPSNTSNHLQHQQPPAPPPQQLQQDQLNSSGSNNPKE